MALLTTSGQFPAYNLTAVTGGHLSMVDAQRPDNYFTTLTSDDYPGKWRVKILRVLGPLQSDQPCACNWKKSGPTLSPGALLSASV
ncbi:alkyl hydroperoxide reductase AhpC [Rhodococcus wratislaviensis IFP 2016]|nr:alkyl hydroperoxide reductase AhpC [Rhodococcus wratislaviensis IFP 2016]